MKPIANDDPPPGFRRLNKNEVVSRGDYVLDGYTGIELWDGPVGFRADSYVKLICRKAETQQPAKRNRT